MTSRGSRDHSRRRCLERAFAAQLLAAKRGRVDGMTLPFFLVLIAVCFSVTGELFLKHGMNHVGILSLASFATVFPKMLRTWSLYAGLGSITIGAGFWLMAISRVDLSWAYPLLAMGYILVMFFSAIVLREPVLPIRWIGAVLIVIGVYLITRS